MEGLHMCTVTNGTQNCDTMAYTIVDETLGFSQGDFWPNTLWCAVSCAAYFVLGYLGLRFFRSGEGK